MAEIKNELLKQAIADAEAVRQTAIANAKIALEETFTPQIKSMLAKRLRAEAMEATEGAEKAKEEPFQDADAVGGNTPVDTSTIGTGDNKEPSPAANDSSDIDQGGEGETDSSTDWYDDWSESDFDLDEVIKELEQDVKALSEAEEKEEEEELDEAMHGEEDEEEKEGDEKEGEKAPEAGEKKPNPFAKKADETYPTEDPEAGVEKPEIPAKSSDIGSAPVKQEAGMAADTNKFVTDPSIPKHEGEMGMEMGMDKGHEAGAGEGEEELDLEAIIRELEAQDAKDAQEKHSMVSRMADLQKELAEYRKVVEVLRGKLNEVNLLNAKLLYTNKIFRKEGLTNEQKVGILESFDRAINVREVKMVYATLAEAMTVKAKTANKSRTVSSKVVTEGLASKPTASTAPKKEILEENTVAKRLQQLAGIL
jgi:hypothetical protein